MAYRSNVQQVRNIFELKESMINPILSRSSQWTQNALILPGNKVNISLETATNYAHDQHANNFGFKCLIIGYDNPSLVSFSRKP